MVASGTVGRWDQRAVVRVELRCTEADFELFEAEVQVRGWKVLERPATPWPPPDRRQPCVLELRFPGSRFRACDAAREHLEALADRLLLDLTVRLVHLVERDQVRLPLWNVYRELPPLPPEVAATRRGRARDRLRRWPVLILGTRDTGRQVQAPDAETALAEATGELAGTPQPPAGVAVRHATPLRAVREPDGRPRPTRRLLPLRYPVLLAIVSGVATGHLPGGWDWLPPVLFLLAVAVGGTRHAPANRPGDRPGRWMGPDGTGLLTVSAAFGVCVGFSAPRGKGGFGDVVMALLLCFLVARGLWLLARQSAWGRTAPWLVPAALTAVPLLLAALGLPLQAMYLHWFGLDMEDVDVPAVTRVLASLKVLATSAVWLIAPAAVGYLRHAHLLIAHRWFGYYTMLTFSVIALLSGIVALSVFPAVMAGVKARVAAESGRTPGPYFGIDPEWVCVLPVKDPAQVPTDGGLLDPARPYLLLGDAGGRAALWDVRERAALKIPLSALRLVPVDDPRRPCP
ncbi:hypothetical protein [Streptomyces sp. NPDC002082]|uniref:hypothetical protein n=1 Tax=Streptomyces sp. NPDC002082 TaxID=3154772 RepID=UPI00332E6924